MADAYRRLLDATIEHLEELRSHGVNFVTIEPRTLAGLRAPVTQGNPAQNAPAAAPPVSCGQPVAAPASPAASATPSPAPAPGPRPPAPQTPPAAPPTLDLARPAQPPQTPAGKEAALAALRARAAVCQKCAHLASSRRNVVFGVGDVQASLMFVGEAPGADEDLRGEPFVGAAGQLLTKMIQAMGLSRPNVYIANILKCRPDTPGQSSGNRKPTPTEMATCLPYLVEQIDLIQPKVIVALGATALEGLLGKTEGISRLRGRWREFRGTPLMPTYHPAYLLRNQSLLEKRKVWEDLLQVMEKLGLPISAKQRGYFLRP